ncbi:MAG: L-2-amino-thiazoline-4-carboxylic acid hydrolase [Ruminococcus sp.]|nr:L-2-amino-thiazoline-4-carboxylic acid hydrolase [Ruminococcus sp.]MCM1380436.1 L-2-amino-thiazoline-4-carboxylic acid hydrolase [Muribaculaceae bacterium]MCM1478406.1 L-2-amino-thiazoline-4-carboxylic acid hydrolase [Muribaculaceae bacterium]
MKENFGTKLYGWFYGNSCKKQLKKEIFAGVNREYKNIVRRAKDIGSSRLLSAYCMCAYFIALNRCTGLSAEENYEIFKKGLYENKLFRKVLGDAENYLDIKKLPDRLKWAENSKKRRYENDWVVEVLPGTAEYDLGYDYLECGVCKLCRDESCPELAKYLCRLDFVLADIMGMELKRTETIAEGYEKCDFRYRKK